MKKVTTLFLLLCFNMVIYSQVGIGTVNPDPDSVLDVVSNNKGMVIPRIALTASNNQSPLTSFVAGMMVYNTATAGVSPNNVTPGLYYSDGVKWNKAIVATTDQTVDVSGLGSGITTPNSFVGATFTPNTPANSDVIYINVNEGTLWAYSGGQYRRYTTPASTEWYLANGTTDAGSNKTGSIYRSGNVGIGTISPSGILDVSSTTSTFIPPRMTSVQQSALVLPPTGAVVFNITANQLQVNTGTPVSPVWANINSNSVAALVPVNTPVTLDNLRIQIINSGAAFQLATVSGTMTANISGTTNYGADFSTSWYSTQRTNYNITTTFAHPFAWGGQYGGNFFTLYVRDTGNNRFYEIKVSNGGSAFATLPSSIIEIRRIF